MQTAAMVALAALMVTTLRLATAQTLSPPSSVTPTVSPSPTVTTDTDSDGVVDELDRCPKTTVSAAVWPSTANASGMVPRCEQQPFHDVSVLQVHYLW